MISGNTASEKETLEQIIGGLRDTHQAFGEASLAAEITTFQSRTGHLSKHFEYGPDSKTLKPAARGVLSDGNAIRVPVFTLDDLARIKRAFTSWHACGYGVTDPEQVRIVSEDKLRKHPYRYTGAIPRNCRRFHLRKGKPGIFVLDIDFKPEIGMPVLTIDGFDAILCKIAPWAGEADRLYDYSCSQGILGPDREPLRPLQNFKVYFIIEDASAIPALLKALRRAFMAAGHVWTETSEDGKRKSIKTFIDPASGTPVALDYAGPASLGKGLTQKRPAAVLKKGTKGRTLGVPTAFIEQWSPKRKERSPGDGTALAHLREVADALRFIPADEYWDWLKVGMALHHDFGEEGRELWGEWSLGGNEDGKPFPRYDGSDKFDYDGQDRTWASFDDDAEVPVTVGSIFHVARENGWPGYHAKAEDEFDELAEPLENEHTPERLKAKKAEPAPSEEDESEIDVEPYDEDTFFDFVERVDINDVDGAARELRDWVFETSPAYQNQNMSLASSISIISTLSGRHLASPTACALNLYLLMLGATGSGKNGPLKRPKSVFEAMGIGCLTTAAFATAAALETHLQKNPCTLACIDEIGNQLLTRFANKKASSHEQVLGAAIRELWSIGFEEYDGTAALTRGGVKRVSRPHFVILGAATEAEFYRALGSGNIINGLFNRFTIIPVGRSTAREDDVPPRPVPPESLVERLKAILPDGSGYALQSPCWSEQPRQVPWAGEDAKEAWLAFRREIDRRMEAASRIEPFVKRTAEQAIRLATLHAVGRDGRNAATVTVADVRWGISFATQSAETAIRGAATHLVENEQQAKARMVWNSLEAIWKRKPVATRSDLYGKIDGRLMRRDLDEITEMLRDQGKIILSDQETGKKGGRPGKTYTKVKKSKVTRP
jgi:hypothetical protein